MTCQDRRDCIGLNGSRHVVAAETDVLTHDRVEASVIELRKSVTGRCRILKDTSTYVLDGIRSLTTLGDDLNVLEALYD